MKRTFWKAVLRFDVEGYPDDCGEVLTTEEDANLVGSLLENGNHAPVIDLDIPAQLIASSTPGHGHLYIDHELTWEQYKRLLLVLAEIGIIEYGYYHASIQKGMSHVRKPGVMKEDLPAWK